MTRSRIGKLIRLLARTPDLIAPAAETALEADSNSVRAEAHRYYKEYYLEALSGDSPSEWTLESVDDALREHAFVIMASNDKS